MIFKPDIKSVRMFEKISQEKLGFEIGTNQGRVSEIENNSDIVRFGIIKEIFQVLGYELFVKKIEED